MSAIFSLVSTPFGYLMRFIYNAVGSYGLSLIIFAVIAKIVTLPITVKQKKTTMQQQRLAPRIKELQKRFGKDPQRMQQEQMALYEREGVSQMGGCGTMIIFFIVTLGLYYVVSQPLTYFMGLSNDEITEIEEIVGFDSAAAATRGLQISLAGTIHENYDKLRHIENVIDIDYNFLNVINLAATPSVSQLNILWIIPILSGLTALLMSLLTQKLTQINNRKMNVEAAEVPGGKMMMLMGPGMSLVFGFVLPAGLGLYWISSNLMSMVVELILFKTIKPLPPLPPLKKKKKKKKPVITDGEVIEVSEEEDVASADSIDTGSEPA